MRKSRFITGILLIVALTLALQPFTSSESYYNDTGSKRQIISAIQLSDFRFIGYYTNSSSPFANAAFYLLKHGALGNSLISFNDLTDLSPFSMIIIPFKKNWTTTEVISLTNFMNQGGIAFLTEHLPPGLLDVTTTTRNGLWITPTDRIAQTLEDKLHSHTDFNYSKGFYDKIKGKFYPFDEPYVRSTKYITAINEPEVEILFTAEKDGVWNSLPDATDYIGYTVVTKKMGAGRIAYSAITLFDQLGLRAIGGPTLPTENRGSIWSGFHLNPLINRLLTLLFLMEDKMIPTRWHTPYSKVAVAISRDDIDNYYATAVKERGQVDQKHSLRSIFFELSDDVPETAWPTVLNTTAEPLGYHIPGYHRNTPIEYTATSYLNRIQDIEAETGRPVYFECHHGGGGSGFYGQNYVRTAIEATNNLSHVVVYTSGEGGLGGNTYLQPYLYLLENNTLVKAKNYYSFPKYGTIDGYVGGNNVAAFQNWVQNSVLAYERPVHWLLHSQNVRGKITSYYDNLLTQVIDPILPDLFTDPIEYVKLSLDYVENATMSFQSTNSTLEAQISCNKDLKGFTFAIAFSAGKIISNIYLDGSPIDLDALRIMAHGFYHLGLFYGNLSAGSHNLAIDFEKGNPITYSLTDYPIPEFLMPPVVIAIAFASIIILSFFIKKNFRKRKL